MPSGVLPKAYAAGWNDEQISEQIMRPSGECVYERMRPLS